MARASLSVTYYVALTIGGHTNRPRERGFGKVSHAISMTSLKGSPWRFAREPTGFAVAVDNFNPN
jgi:hypothetical protein